MPGRQRASLAGPSVAVVAVIVAFAAVVWLWMPEVWPLLRMTYSLALATVAGAAPWGAVLAILLGRTDVYGRGVLLFITALMVFAPLYLQAAAWEAGFGRLGWYTLINDQVGSPLLTGWRAAVWVHIAAAAPWVTVIVLAALRYVDARQEEAARLEGGVRGALRGVVLPQLGGALLVAVLWVFVTVSAEMTVADLFFINTFARELYNSFGLDESLGQIYGYAWPGLGTTLTLAAAAAFCLARFAPLGSPQLVRRVTPWGLGRGRPWLSLLAWLLVLAFSLVPLANLLLKAGWIPAERSWSAAEFVDVALMSPWRFRVELGWSLAIGALAASLAVGTAAPLAFWARRGGWRSGPLVVLSALAVATPGPLLGLLIVLLFSRDLGPLNVLYDQTLLAPVLATSVRAFPFVAAILWFAFRTIDPKVLESASLDGGGGASLWRLALPLRTGMFTAAWLVALAIASGDLAATILVAPPGVTTAAVRVFGLIHSGVRNQEAGLSLASLTMYVIAAAGAAWLIRGAANRIR